MSWSYDIRVENPAPGVFVAIDDQRYDCDGDSEGYYPNYAQATGNSKWEAVRELINNLEEEDNRELAKAAYAEGEADQK